MECLVIGIAVIAGFFLLAIALLAGVGGSHWKQGFQQVARRFHGTLHSGGWFQTPCVWLRHGKAQARLTISALRGGGGEQCLQFTIQQSDITSRTEVFYYQTRETLLPIRRGLWPVEFDWKDFRRRWRVLAEDGDAARQFLSDGVRLAIELLWRQPQSAGNQLPSEMTISLSPGWLVVRKIWHSPRGADLESFVEQALALSDQLNLAVAAGIEFVAGEEPQLLENARCGVCGESLASELVVCRRCNTPHHRECWQYGGGCATYGCGGRECAPPGVAERASSSSPSNSEQDSKPMKPR